MTVDEMLRALRRDLEKDYGVEATAYLMDRPRGGWDSLVTKEVLDLKLETLKHQQSSELAGVRSELKGEIADVRSEIANVRIEIANLASELRKEMRDQTRWLTGVLLIALTLVAAIARFT